MRAAWSGGWPLESSEEDDATECVGQSQCTQDSAVSLSLSYRRKMEIRFVPNGGMRSFLRSRDILYCTIGSAELLTSLEDAAASLHGAPPMARAGASHGSALFGVRRLCARKRSPSSFDRGIQVRFVQRSSRLSSTVGCSRVTAAWLVRRRGLLFSL